MTINNNVLNISDILFLLVLFFAELVATPLIKHDFALQPHVIASLWNVLTAPLMHSGWMHLFNNAVSLVVLLVVLRSFFKNEANLVFIASYILPGVFTWFIGKPSYHLGASGIVYGLGSFIIVSSLLRRERHLAVVSLVLVLFNGSAVWGLLPVKSGVSWEYHLGGFLTGIICALGARVFSRKQENESINVSNPVDITAQGIEIHYIFKEETD